MRKVRTRKVLKVLNFRIPHRVVLTALAYGVKKSGIEYRVVRLGQVRSD